MPKLPHNCISLLLHVHCFQLMRFQLRFHKVFFFHRSMTGTVMSFDLERAGRDLREATSDNRSDSYVLLQVYDWNNDAL